MASSQTVPPSPCVSLGYLAVFAELLDMERAKNALLCMQLIEERSKTVALMNQITLRPDLHYEVSYHTQPHCARQVGVYSQAVRQLKIARYKAKLKGRILRARETRGSKGRSLVAQGKPRVKGRFVKTEQTET